MDKLLSRLQMMNWENIHAFTIEISQSNSNQISQKYKLLYKLFILPVIHVSALSCTELI